VTPGISHNWRTVLDEMAKACERAGRDASEVNLVAVSKNFLSQDIMEAYYMGQRIFGESRVQEFLGKADGLPEDIQWHFIGRLQRNKVKYIVDRIRLLHSLDSVPLAEEISRQACFRNAELPVLVQVNMAREASKGGFVLEELEDALDRIKDLPGMKVRGLMTIGPWSASPEDARPLFKKLRLLSKALEGRVFPHKLDMLSMGMSDDFAIAIEEGATLIRVGSGIFGAR
jgi:pyridoxal phosphate enzyme (YggS family)